MKKPLPLIAGNWKMFKTVPEAVASVKALIRLAGHITDIQIMIAPPYTALFAVSATIEGSRILLGAQDVFWEKEGAFTGEISASMLVSAGCRFVIIGHSERRQFFGETDEMVNKKVKCVVRENLAPVMCIGETGSQREAGKTFSVLDKQIQVGLENMVSDDLNNLVIAYEPVWAIGTGKTATKEQAQEAHRFIRNRIEESFGKSIARSVRILYGGSVKPDNISELMAMPDINGALVGGASLKPETFSQIIHYKKQV